MHQIEASWTDLLWRGMDENLFVHRDARTLALPVLGMIVSVWRWCRPRGAVTLGDVSDLIEDACARMVTP